jgi:hypothetical protein
MNYYYYIVRKKVPLACDLLHYVIEDNNKYNSLFVETEFTIIKILILNSGRCNLE